MLLPLAQKMSKVFGRCEDLTVKTEFFEGLGNTYGFDMARKEELDTHLTRVLYYNVMTQGSGLRGGLGSTVKNMSFFLAPSTF